MCVRVCVCSCVVCVCVCHRHIAHFADQAHWYKTTQPCQLLSRRGWHWACECVVATQSGPLVVGEHDSPWRQPKLPQISGTHPYPYMCTYCINYLPPPPPPPLPAHTIDHLTCQLLCGCCAFKTTTQCSRNGWHARTHAHTHARTHARTHS